MIVKLLTEYHLEFLSLKGGFRGSSESTHVKMSHCWKSHALTHIYLTYVVSGTGIYKHLDPLGFIKMANSRCRMHIHQENNGSFKMWDFVTWW